MSSTRAPRARLTAGAVVSALLVGPGCGALTGTVVGLSGQWPTTSTHEDKAWVNGEPVASLTVEARLETPPRAICRQVRHEPAAHVEVDSWGFDTGGRLAYGFFGLAELGLASALAFLPSADDPARTGTAVAATVVGLDGVAALALAFLIPDRHYHSSYELPPQDLIQDTCPPDVAFGVAGQSFPVGPDGRLEPVAARSLMLAAAETGEPIVLEFHPPGAPDGVRRFAEVPLELRCSWAIDLGSAIIPVVCPHVPVVHVVPVVPGGPGLRPPPIR